MTLASASDPVPAGTPAVFILALTMVLTAGLGVPHTELLQDTLKSMLVAIGTLLAALAYFWQLRSGTQRLSWHPVLGLPLLLLAYALGSMAWSHAWLAGGEALRWFVLGLLAWLTSQVVTRERWPLLATGIHLGALLASLWTLAQFWFDFKLFPQGPNPASTFVNRNFLAEFVVATLPYAALLLARAQTSKQILRLSLSTGLCVLAVLMTGTRSALVSMAVLALLLPLAAWRCRGALACVHWTGAQRALAAGVFLASVLGLGLIPSGNPAINAEHGTALQVNALQRSLARAASAAQPAEYRTGSFSQRIQMWQATMRMIQAQPLSGVGAGAWEVEIPLYQPPGMLLETDYYAHNEFLQLLAEYGLVGWLFLLGLHGWLGHAAWRTWSDATPQGREEAPQRAVALASLLALMLVSSAGFPWRLAGTGALLALGLGLLAASELRSGRLRIRSMPCTPRLARGLVAATALCLACASYVSWQAALCEQKIVRAVSLGLAISASGDALNPKWNADKANMLELMREGIAINPHYRKLTPLLADELADWGDWKNAIWIWESVLASRPHVTAILSNLARAHLHLNQLAQAQGYWERARRLQPQARAVRTLEVILLYRGGQEEQALQRIRPLLQDDRPDLDVLSIAYEFGRKHQDPELAIQALTLRRQHWPEYAVDSSLKLGHLYAQLGKPAEALAAYRTALAATPEVLKEAVRQRIPAALRDAL